MLSINSKVRHKSLKFTVDKFENETPHFLDLEIHPDGISIYRKDTHTGQYVNYTSYTNWNYKIAWIRSLITRAKTICSPNKWKQELFKIKLFAAYNGFPKRVINNVIKKCKESQTTKKTTRTDEHFNCLYLNLPYLGVNAEHIVRSTKRKLQRYFKKDICVKFNVQLKTTKLSFYASTKDRLNKLSNSYAVYHFNCPGCHETYIGKTQCTLYKRTLEHAHEQKDSAIYKHLMHCHGYHHIMDLHKIDNDLFDDMEFQLNAVRNNTRILDKANDWLKLLFMEALFIKEHNPTLNDGLKASKSLKLF